MTDSSLSPAVKLFEARSRELNRERRFASIIYGLLFLICLAISIHFGEFRISTLIDGLPGLFNYINDISPQIRMTSFISDLGEWYWRLGVWLRMIVDTVLLAFVGTFLGVTGAFFICFPASRNLVRQRWVYLVSRRLMELARAIPELVYAMIFVFSFGLGPFPGVLAIAIHTIGALGKLFSEVNENIDMNPIEGARASGATWKQMIRFSVVPQVLPNFISYSLLRFEINVRAASIIGFVGAGGIGQELMFVIRQFVYTDISAIVILIIAIVMIIDFVCEKIRHRIIGAGVRA